MLALQPGCYGQTGDQPENRFGLGLQVYPAGFIPTVSYEHYLGPRTSLLYRVGANITDRRDFSSKNEEEKGSGFGGSVGYRTYVPLQKGSLVFGLHADLWNLWIDWNNPPGSQWPLSGTTYILVLQPWLEAGYIIPIKKSRSRVGFSLGFGREINLITDGRAVEQDWIASARIYYQISI